MNAECGKPGHLYPDTEADRAALLAGPGDPAFWKSSMIARCHGHAPVGDPAPLFGDQVLPCEHPEPEAGG
jgi:hypothetical protein